MPFMEPEIIQGRGWEVETDGGTFYVPDLALEATVGPVARILMQYAPEPVGGRHVAHRRVKGYFCRLSAPGYLDATDWEFFTTEADADAWAAEEESAVDEDEDEDEDEGGPFWSEDEEN